MDKNNIKEYSYNVYIRRTEKLPDLGSWSSYLEIIKSFTCIGGCEEKPYVKVTSEGSKLLSGGRIKSTKDRISFSTKDLQVNSFNYIYLRTLLKKPVDIVFENKDIKRVFILKSFRIKAEINIVGNDFDFVMLTGEVSTGYIDNFINFLDFEENNSEVTIGPKIYFAGSSLRRRLKPNENISNQIIFSGSKLRKNLAPNEVICNGLLYGGSDIRKKLEPNSNIFNGLFYAGGQ